MTPVAPQAEKNSDPDTGDLLGLTEKSRDRSHPGILSLYFTAGFPSLNDTGRILKGLDAAGADLVEVGMPFSDPLADGPTIQESSRIALENGMTLDRLFAQVKEVREEIAMPLVLMGYYNPVFQLGEERFCEKCKEAGIDGVILPDLPLEEYKGRIESVFRAHELAVTFLITPQTPEDRVRALDRASTGFLYMVSAASTTGVKKGFQPEQIAYFERIAKMGLDNPRLIGFGIGERDAYTEACNYADGVVIGSAFIKALKEMNGSLEDGVDRFVRKIRGS